MKNKLLNLAVLPALLAGSLPLHAENLTPNLKFNGFASAMVSVLDDDQGGSYIPDFYGYPGISETANAGLESNIGLQFDYRVNDKVNVVTQLVAQGRNNYNVGAEWAYIGYQINDQLRFRAGRFALLLLCILTPLMLGNPIHGLDFLGKLMTVFLFLVSMAWTCSIANH